MPKLGALGWTSVRERQLWLCLRSYAVYGVLRGIRVRWICAICHGPCDVEKLRRLETGLVAGGRAMMANDAMGGNSTFAIQRSIGVYSVSDRYSASRTMGSCSGQLTRFYGNGFGLGHRGPCVGLGLGTTAMLKIRRVISFSHDNA